LAPPGGTGVDSPPTVERREAQHVLVVDDDSSIRLLCRINLELEGWTVREAESLAEARRELAAVDVAVVLLDVHVGLESGVQFLDELKRDHPRLPVAMLTGSVERSTIADLPAEAVIAKPFTLDQLSETVRVLAAGGRVESPRS
jgi:DNA-binding NtrC family response regulator